MENKENTKPVWQAPKIVVLDLDKTATGDIYPFEVNDTAGPS